MDYYKTMDADTNTHKHINHADTNTHKHINHADTNTHKHINHADTNTHKHINPCGYKVATSESRVDNFGSDVSRRATHVAHGNVGIQTRCQAEV